MFIEVPTGPKKMPTVGGKKIFTLRPQRKQWSLDKCGTVKISRFGFPLVPDFGGTAHAYCGTTQETNLGDLLPWHKTTQMADMLKAYIIKSRVRVAENLLIVQPYSPHLFRQGVNPGPQLLLNVLTKKMSEKEAKAEWKRLAKNKEDAATTGESWLLSQTIPCRRCSDRDRDNNEV